MKSFILITLALALAGCASHPLEGRVWDTRTASFVSPDAVYDRAAASRYVMLGEQHDSKAHHRMQLEALQALAERDRKPALAMEQFDRDNQRDLSAAQAAGTKNADRLADAGKLNKKGWDWPMYRRLVAFAAGKGWPLVAANLSRSDARDIAMGKVKPSLPPMDAAQVAKLEDEIVRGHCGHRPGPDGLAAIVTAQRSRDASIAEALDAVGGPVVLIAGTSHVRRDRAAPLYVADGSNVLSVAYVEVAEGKESPELYDGEGFDLLWFTEATKRISACGKPLTGLAAPSR